MDTNEEDHGSPGVSTDDISLTRGDGAPPEGRAQGQTDKNDKNDKNDTGHVSDPTELPQEVYSDLPATLGHVADTYSDAHERDTFLTGVLPVCAGAMPNTRLRYGGQWLSLNLYTAVVAPAASGKGKMRDARRCGADLDERLYKQSQKQQEKWEDDLDTEGVEAGEKPSDEMLFLPGDCSASEMKHLLDACPNGVLFETEFKTVGTTLGQDWGQYRDVLLKSFHNEPVKVGRRSEDLVRIQHPSLSVALSGTPSTFHEVVEEVEDGLFSRFCFYSFETSMEWEPQFEDQEDLSRDDAIQAAARRLDDLHSTLDERDEPLYVKMPDAQRKKHTRVCEAVVAGMKKEGVPEKFYSSVKRAGLTAFRIAALLRILRHKEKGKNLGAAESIEVGERDLYPALLLAFAYLSHAFRVAEVLDADDAREGLHQGHQDYLDALPEGRFDTATADRIAREIGVADDGSTRKAERWRKKFASKGLLVDEDHGYWRKPAGKNAADVVSVDNVVSVAFDD